MKKFFFSFVKKLLKKNYYNFLLYFFHLFPSNFKGYSLENNLNIINKVIQRHSCSSLLDYGCGKALMYSKKKLFNKSIKKIFLYDPYYFKFMIKPSDKYDITICTDVMEHIKKRDANTVIKNINKFTKKAIFFSISTELAKKHLPDGTNAHINLLKKDIWIKKIKNYQKKNITTYLRFNNENKVYKIKN